MSDILDEARAFADKHVYEASQEILNWQITSRLCNGRVRQLAKMLRVINAEQALTLAENEFKRAALRVCACAVMRNPDDEE